MSAEPMFNPLLAHRLAISSVGIPDPIEFVISEKFLDRGVLYPRQATLLKTIFLRDDLFTDFDLEVIDGWETTFMRTGNEGISPGIHQRIEINKAAGRSWFKEVLAVIGRRGGKGHLGAICSAYILWHFLNRPGGPQTFYGIDRDKTIAAIVFAGKKDQAKANQWGDLNKFITSAPCFRPYLSKALAESLTIYSPADLLKIQRQKFDGTRIESDQASFAITPSASTMMAGRGPASAILMFDEMAHIIASGASRSAAEIYNCLHPDTRVLTSELRWKRIDDLVEGESLMAFDEETDGRPGSSRRLREAQVEHKWDTHGLAYRISFDDGSSVVCSGNHRWLASGDQKGKNWSWRSIETPPREGLRGGGNPKSLKVGDLIRKVTPDPWEQETSYESGYLAGMLDGEGHVRWDAGLRVVFTQKPGPVLDRVDRHLGQLGYTARSHVHVPSGCVNVNVNGIEGLRLIGSLGLTRLAENLRSQWEGKTFRRAASKKIVSIEPLEEQRLVDLQTSTGTFIAEGLASHNSAMPSLDQFGVDGFSYQGSSPWQMQGQFYDNWQNAIALEPDGTPSFPNMMMIQMPSWNVYLDYERAHELPLRPPTKKWIEVTVPDTMIVNGEETPTTRTEIREVDEVGPTLPPIRSAVQTYDEDMKAKERANPDSFAVEYRSHWALSLSSYLDEKKVAEAFRPFEDNGTTRTLTMQTRGPLSHYYKAHADPGAVNDNFAFAMGHVERPVGSRFPHVVIDLLKMWKPIDFPDGIVDYPMVTDDLWDIIERFSPDELTFDQFQSVMMIATLNQRMTAEPRPKQTLIFEKPATRPLNWKRAELFKSALNLGWVHIPMLGLDGEVDPAGEMAELELRFLELRNGRVDHPTSGPIQHNDLSDCLFEVVWALIGEELLEMLESPVMSQVSGTGAGGVEPPLPKTPQSDPMQALANANRGAMTQRGMGSARGMRRR